MAGRSTNTFSEWIERTISDLAQAKLLPDADVGFLVSMETQLIDAYKGMTGMTGMEQQGMIPPQPAAPAGPSFLGAGGTRGLGMGGPTPNPDELRRILSMG